jgi:hypothetical protein
MESNLSKWINAIKEAAPAAAIALYEYAMNKIKREQIEKQKVELKLAELEATNANHAKFDGRSDDSIIDSVTGGEDPK